MKQVTLETLFCETTEDTFGSDSCRLEIYADGELDQALRAELNNGEQWAVNARRSSSRARSTSASSTRTAGFQATTTTRSAW